MDEGHVNSYYALVWNTSLDSNMKLRGTKITRSTKLPSDPRMLYGTNRNDVAKIRKVKFWQEIEYDPFTTRQGIKFWDEVDEYNLSRDIFIVVWEGEDRLSLPHEHYKIVSPEFFEHIVAMAPESGDNEKAWINPVEELISEEEVHDFKDYIEELTSKLSYHNREDGKLTMQSVSY